MKPRKLEYKMKVNASLEESKAVPEAVLQAFVRADRLIDKGYYVKALELTEDSISACREMETKGTGLFLLLQGSIFSKLAEESKNRNLKCAYLLAAVETLYLADTALQDPLDAALLLAHSVFHLADHLVSKKLYRKAARIARLNLASCEPDREDTVSKRKDLEEVLEIAESRMEAVSATTLGDFGTVVERNEPIHRITKGTQEEVKARNKSLAEILRPYWAGMSAKRKRATLKISIIELKSFVEKLYGTEGRETLERGLRFAQECRKWKLWKCRSCSKEFQRQAELKKHLEKDHGAKFRLPSHFVVPHKSMTAKVDDVWVGNISGGDWKPVDTVAALRMMKNVKKFAYVDGWSKDWPSVGDEVRRKQLKEIHKILELLEEHEILSRSIREWLVNYVVKHLGISQSFLEECGLGSTPQCICLLGSHGLEEVCRYLRLFRFHSVDGTDMVSRAMNEVQEANGFMGRCRVKERINFDDKFSCLLVDKRLLTGTIKAFDNEGAVSVVDSDHCSGISPQGDEIVDWLYDCPMVDYKYEFRESVREHNIQIWMAVLKAIHFKVRTLEMKYHKKSLLLRYDEALREAENLCNSEAERRKNIPEDQWKAYASILRDKCETTENDVSVEHFQSAVLDILEESDQPRVYDVGDDSIDRISEHSNLDDKAVLRSLSTLQTAVSEKIPLKDSKILLIDISRAKLLDDLIELSVFDYRSDIIQLVKCFLRHNLEEARSAEAIAALSQESNEKKEKQPMVQERKRKSQKGFRKEEKDKKVPQGDSTGTSSTHDQTEEPKASAGSEMASALVKEEEDEEKLTEKAFPKDNLSSESEHVRVSEDQKETSTEDKKSDPRDESLENGDVQSKDEELSTQLVSAPTEEAIRNYSVLDMMLKALWQINAFREEIHRCGQPVQHHGHRGERCVPCAMQNLFSSFASTQINDEDLHRYLLNELISALENSQSMETDAAELLISVLEFLQYWKNPLQGESLVTCLFTLEEFERMSCNSCRRVPNYPKQRSYGLRICANSVREFKSAFRYMKFEDILKAIRINFQMYCDKTSGGCGKRNYVCHDLTRCPSVFIITLEWEEIEDGEEIFETAQVLDTEIDISVLYKGIIPLTSYRLVSMIGCSGEEEYSCIAYENDRWVTHDPSVKMDMGNWNKVVRFCRDREIRPQILFYEATSLPKKP